MAADSSDSQNRPPGWAIRLNRRFFWAFGILLVLWIVLSGRFDLFHLAMGVGCSAFVAFVSGDLMFSSATPTGVVGLWVRLAAYIPWLIVQIFKANVHVMMLVFHPRMRKRINPRIIRFNSRLKSDYARMLLANAITLTPGTITVGVTALGRFAVHCIDDASARALPGEMEARVAAVFKE